MLTVHEVSELTGVTVRALQHYDNVGLLKPTCRTEAGYRLYDEEALEKLQQILLFRELEFPLKDIKRIVEAPNFDRAQALEQQIELLELKQEHLQNLITHARNLQAKSYGTERAITMDFKAFDTSTIEEYAEQAKATWGNTPEYQEFEARDKGRTPDERQRFGAEMMELFVEFASLKDKGIQAPEAQAQVKKLQDYISEHFYKCSDEVLAGLGKMYAAGGEFTANIDEAAGAGTAVFAAQAIAEYCAQR